MEYVDLNGIKHKYFPDFRIEGYYVELKGSQFVTLGGTWKNPYNTNDVAIEAKRQYCISHQVKILYSNECEKIIDEVESKHGKGYIQQFRNTRVLKQPAQIKTKKKTLINLLLSKEENIYYNNNPNYFEELLNLVQTYPKSYTRKIEAKGRKRESQETT